MVDTQQPAALAIIGVFLGLSTLLVVMRIVSRIIQWNSDNWDWYMKCSDGLILSAYICVVGESYVVITYTLYTWQGYHTLDIPKMSIEDQVKGQQYNFANQLLYNPILSLVKASVIFFFLRIANTRKRVKTALWVAQAINLALAVAIFFADTFQCTPLRYVYDYPRMDLAAQEAAGADNKGMLDGIVVKGGKCFDQIKFFLVSAGMTILTDFMVLAMPSVILWDLQLPRRRKIIAGAILSVGLLVTAISIARLVVYNWRFSPNNHDRTYGVGYTVSSMEANLAIAIGCVPTLGPLVRRLSPKFFGSSGESASRPTPSGYIQQSVHRKNDKFELKYLGSNSVGSMAHGRQEPWASDENILQENMKIRKDVDVNVVFSEAREKNSMDGGRSEAKQSL